MKREVDTGILAITVLLILSIIISTLGLAYAISYLIFLAELPLSFNLPTPLRLIGFGLIAVGIMLEFSVMRYRRPMDVLISTSDTIAKFLWKQPISRRTRRTEPFIPKGPYVYTRNPMYLGVVTIAFGFGLTYSSVPLLVWGAVVTSWFLFIQIPFEENELSALFGKSYADYKRQVPILFPYGRKYKE